MDLQKIEKILELIDRTGFWEVEIEEGDLRVRAKKNIPTSIKNMVVEEGKPKIETQVSTKSIIEKNNNQVTIKSPLVGTFYRSPSPGTPVFVEVGDIVKKGQTLCIVEAMKLMNGVEAEVDGRIVSIFVENARPVEYGEPLFLIETTSPR